MSGTEKMKHASTTETAENYYIFDHSTGLYLYQRKTPDSPTERQLNTHELIIISLCKELLSSS